MRCPNCDGHRIVLAAVPGQRPDRTCVCLGCAHLWDAEHHILRTPRSPPDG